MGGAALALGLVYRTLVPALSWLALFVPFVVVKDAEPSMPRLPGCAAPTREPTTPYEEATAWAHHRRTVTAA